MIINKQISIEKCDDCSNIKVGQTLYFRSIVESNDVCCSELLNSINYCKPIDLTVDPIDCRLFISTSVSCTNPYTLGNLSVTEIPCGKYILNNIIINNTPCFKYTLGDINSCSIYSLNDLLINGSNCDPYTLRDLTVDCGKYTLGNILITPCNKYTLGNITVSPNNTCNYYTSNNLTVTPPNCDAYTLGNITVTNIPTISISPCYPITIIGTNNPGNDGVALRNYPICFSDQNMPNVISYLQSSPDAIEIGDGFVRVPTSTIYSLFTPCSETGDICDSSSAGSNYSLIFNPNTLTGYINYDLCCNLIISYLTGHIVQPSDPCGCGGGAGNPNCVSFNVLDIKKIDQSDTTVIGVASSNAFPCTNGVSSFNNWVLWILNPPTGLFRFYIDFELVAQNPPNQQCTQPTIFRVNYEITSGTNCNNCSSEEEFVNYNGSGTKQLTGLLLNNKKYVLITQNFNYNTSGGGNPIPIGLLENSVCRSDAVWIKYNNIDYVDIPINNNSACTIINPCNNTFGALANYYSWGAGYNEFTTNNNPLTSALLLYEATRGSNGGCNGSSFWYKLVCEEDFLPCSTTVNQQNINNDGYVHSCPNTPTLITVVFNNPTNWYRKISIMNGNSVVVQQAFVPPNSVTNYSFTTQAGTNYYVVQVTDNLHDTVMPTNKWSYVTDCGCDFYQSGNLILTPCNAYSLGNLTVSPPLCDPYTLGSISTCFKYALGNLTIIPCNAYTLGDLTVCCRTPIQNLDPLLLPYGCDWFIVDINAVLVNNYSIPCNQCNNAGGISTWVLLIKPDLNNCGTSIVGSPTNGIIATSFNPPCGSIVQLKNNFINYISANYLLGQVETVTVGQSLFIAVNKSWYTQTFGGNICVDGMKLYQICTKGMSGCSGCNCREVISIYSTDCNDCGNCC